MATFKISGTMTVSCWTEVEAYDEAEALSIAKSREVAQFHIDQTYPEDECWHMDADGAPDNLRVDN